ncbi:hypothetical protein [Flavobacterium sp.]|uniref:glycosyltransferase family protein n=1 Tax=Flavobacterium sp. TaxID=239 RepID=UPI00374D8043
MSQKICVISFDHWNYDCHIVSALQEIGIASFHIKIGNFKHTSLYSRFINTLSKIFIGKNPKIQKRQEYILNQLEKKGFQDQILVINPETIDLENHLKIKKYTSKYIAYLYDSVERNPVNHLLNGVFDEIYSFDKKDISNYNFKETTNYNYISKTPIASANKIKNEILYIASFDNRLDKIKQLKSLFEKINRTYRFIIVGKKTTLYKIKNLFSTQSKNLDLRRKRINQTELKKLYSETKIVLDIVRDNQIGLSFRVFEAMAYQKKIITNNKSIMEYDFYNPNNILVLQNKTYEFESSFFETAYQPIAKEIYDKYTVQSWVKKIFNLN